MNHLELKPAINDRAMCGPVRYLEIYIDGVSLRERFSRASGQIPEQISALGWEVAGAEAFAHGEFQRLLLAAPADLPDGRNSILICPLDGDVGCGAYSVRMECVDNTVIWREFGFENNYDPDARETEQYAHIGPFTFAWEQYTEELVRHRGAE